VALAGNKAPAPVKKSSKHRAPIVTRLGVRTGVEERVRIIKKEKAVKKV